MGTFQGWGLNVFDEVYGIKRGRKNYGDTWWWKDEVEEAV